MPYAEHESFSTPSRDAVVWRYMDFAKYVSLLHSDALFFCRLDRLGDPFEGSVPTGYRDAEMAMLRELVGPEGAAAGVPEKLEAVKIETAQSMRGWCAVNCWHVSGHESAAMWPLYSSGGLGVAVRSTFGGLSDSFHRSTDDIYIGTVRYIDYECGSIPDGNLLAPALHKRLSFAHEAELRALTWSVPFEKGRTEMPFGKSRWETGCLVPTDLGMLVDEVRVSPTAPEYFYRAVTEVTKRFNRGWDVKQSDLLRDPIF